MLKLNNQKGMSLVGVLVAAAIMGGLSLAAVKIMEMLSQGNRSANQNFNITSIAEEMRVLLANIDSCNNSLANYVVTSEANFQLKNKLDKTAYEPGKRIGENISISKLYIERPLTLTDPYRGTLNAVVIFEKSGKNPMTTKRILKVIGNVSGGKIVDCLSYETEAIESSVARSCEYTGGSLTGEGKCSYANIQDGEFKNSIKNISLEKICQSMGGTINGTDCAISEFKGDFKKAIQYEACNMLGGNLVGGQCVNIKIK